MKAILIKSRCAILALGAVVLTSCCKNNDPEATASAVCFTATITPQTIATKAAGTAFTTGDNIGVFMVKAGNMTIAEEADNKQYTLGNSSDFRALPGEEIYFPINGSRVDFIAYYPHLATLSGWLYNVNVGTQTSQSAIDLLYSRSTTGKDQNSGSVPLLFRHELSRVIINTVAGEGFVSADLAKMSVKIKGMHTQANFDLSTGKLGTSHAPADIVPATTTAGSKYEAIVLPATFATAGSLTMAFALHNTKEEVFVWSCPANETFAPATQYTYTITIARTGVTATCSITPWTDIPRIGVAQ